MRREYQVSDIMVNGVIISKVIIDPHVDKHTDHIDDELILELVRHLHLDKRIPVSVKSQYSYFATKIKHDGKWYKMVWLLEKDQLYVGVITVYRDRRIL